MSAPTTHDPLVVNTRDGVCWTRRTVTPGGIALYAPESAVTCPDFVMATLTELAEHGIAGSAHVLPMPVGPKPLALSEQQIEALAEAGNRVVNDEVHERLCMCDTWPEKCLSSGNFHMGDWDMSGLESALPAVIALWEQMRGGELVALRARVAELEAAPKTVYRASHESIVFGLYTTAEAAREHCESYERRHRPNVELDWIEDEEDGVAELAATVDGEESTTGYIVAALEVASAYDEEADE